MDLTDPDNIGKGRQRRFLDRVCTPAEADFLREREAAADADVLLWAVWASKEGAYKAMAKAAPGISSAPSRYEVRFDDVRRAADLPGSPPSFFSGAVATPAGPCFFSGELSPRRVLHVVAATAPVETLPLISEVLSLTELQDRFPGDPHDLSRLLRRALLAAAAPVLACPESSLSVVRPQTPSGLGPPRLLRDGLPVGDISLSHDGPWGAFVFLPDLS